MIRRDIADCCIVLLREDGIPMDARIYVEDCRQSIIKYLKNRWLSTRSMDGFADLDSWALKEIADGQFAG